MESGGMTSTAKQFDVRKIDDIIALIALYRPGPMDLIGDYIKRKKGLTKIRYEHPLLEEICADTYGVMIYQEQVMAAAHKLAGYSLAQGDLLRRAMGKKDKEKMAKERQTFIAGCARTNNIPEKKANAIFDLLEKFAGYGFNKSHSAAYGLISYQTAYLKAHYPVEFMAGLLSNEISNTDKISVFVGECKRMGIAILPPDMNKSGLKFTPEMWEGPQRPESQPPEMWEGPQRPESQPDAQNRGTEAAPTFNAIRYGLAAIKHVGEAAMQMAIEERERNGPYTSLDDFCARIGTRIANRKMLESLVKAGAFDFVGQERAELFACIDEALACSAAAYRDRASGQVSLFDETTAPMTSSRRRTVQPWSEHEKLSYEKELLGFYVSGHPLDAYVDLFAAKGYQSVSSLAELGDRAVFKTAGAIVHLEKKFRRSDGKPYAILALEDLTGTIEIFVWDDVYSTVAHLLATGRVVAVQGTIDQREDRLRGVAQKIKVLGADKANESGNGKEKQPAGEEAPLVLRFSRETTSQELKQVHELLANSPGPRRVELQLDRETGAPICISAAADLRVELTKDLAEQLSRWLMTSKTERRDATVNQTTD